MQARIAKKYRNKFQPSFPTAIMGQIVKVTLGEAEKNPEKWIDSPIAPFYENYKELKEQIHSRRKKAVPVKLDMNHANRGSVFANGGVTKKQDAVNKFIANQEIAKARLLVRFEKKKKRIADAEKAKKMAVTKAVNQRIANDKKAQKTAITKAVNKEVEKRMAAQNESA
jgi:hypothetical protein